MGRIVEYRDIPLDQLEIGMAQVRLGRVTERLDELALSIDKAGLLQPIVVAPMGNDAYEIILGQRRFLAHQQLRRKTITCGVLDERISQIEAKAMSLTENLLRENMTRADLVDACQYLYKEYGTYQAVAERTGLSATYVSAYVRTADLAPVLQEMVRDNEIDVTVAHQAQKAADVIAGGEQEADEETYARLARELTGFSGPQRARLISEVEKTPDREIDELFEDAATGARVVTVIVTLTGAAHSALQEYAKDAGTNQDNAAAMLLTEALGSAGFTI